MRLLVCGSKKVNSLFLKLRLSTSNVAHMSNMCVRLQRTRIAPSVRTNIWQP